MEVVSGRHELKRIFIDNGCLVFHCKVKVESCAFQEFEVAISYGRKSIPGHSEGHVHTGLGL